METEVPFDWYDSDNKKIVRETFLLDFYGASFYNFHQILNKLGIQETDYVDCKGKTIRANDIVFNKETNEIDIVKINYEFSGNSIRMVLKIGIFEYTNGTYTIAKCLDGTKPNILVPTVIKPKDFKRYPIKKFLVITNSLENDKYVSPKTMLKYAYYSIRNIFAEKNPTKNILDKLEKDKDLLYIHSYKIESNTCCFTFIYNKKANANVLRFFNNKTIPIQSWFKHTPLHLNNRLPNTLRAKSYLINGQGDIRFNDLYSFKKLDSILSDTVVFENCEEDSIEDFLSKIVTHKYLYLVKNLKGYTEDVRYIAYLICKKEDEREFDSVLNFINCNKDFKIKSKRDIKTFYKKYCDANIIEQEKIPIDQIYLLLKNLDRVEMLYLPNKFEDPIFFSLLIYFYTNFQQYITKR